MTTRNHVEHHGTLGENPDGTKLYASVPMELARDKKLSPSTGRVALYIWSHNASWNQSAKDVAGSLGMDRGAVSRALVDLQMHGWLIREFIYRPGNAKPSGERWHLQMSNTRFTPEEIEKLGGLGSPGSPGGLLLKAAPPDRGPAAKSSTPCGFKPHPPAAKSRTIVVETSSARSAHYLSSATKPAALGSTSLPRADARAGGDFPTGHVGGSNEVASPEERVFWRDCDAEAYLAAVVGDNRCDVDLPESEAWVIADVPEYIEILV